MNKISNRYFIVELTNGIILDFNGKCDSIDYNNNKFCVFKHTINDKNYRILALIPYSSIYNISSYGE